MIDYYWFILLIIGLGALYYFWSQKQKNKTIGSEKTPTLDHFSKDLTLLAKKGELDPVINRENEIRRVIQILSRKKKNNPVLIGPPGVGKTAIVEGLALKIAQGKVPEILKKKRVLNLDLTGLMSGTKYRGEFEKRLQAITNEIKAAKRNIIVFIDELHVLAETRGTEGALAASDMLKPSLAAGQLQAIGATTPEEYERYIKKDLTLERRFQIVPVKKPTIKDAIEILKGVQKAYENYHKVKISDKAISTSVILSDKYIKDRFLPDKAIDLIDEACAKERLEVLDNPKHSPIVTEKDIKEIISSWVDLPVEEIYI
jgi:ATP-dependent Clp protease ATP-binding subunit ClpC